MTNHIIQEVRDARAALAAEHGYDHRRIFEWAKAAQAARQKTLESKIPHKVLKSSGQTGRHAAAPLR